MPHTPYGLELHDSEISEVALRNGSAVVVFTHAYIHKDGKGWSQQAELEVYSAALSSGPLTYPARISDGMLQTTLGAQDNLIQLPLRVQGEVTLQLALTSGDRLHITGNGAEVRLTSEPIFVENIPGL